MPTRNSTSGTKRTLIHKPAGNRNSENGIRRLPLYLESLILIIRQHRMHFHLGIGTHKVLKTRCNTLRHKDGERWAQRLSAYKALSNLRAEDVWLNCMDFPVGSNHS